MKKRWLCMLMAMLLTLSMIGCGIAKPAPTDNTSSKRTHTFGSKTSETEEDTSEASTVSDTSEESEESEESEDRVFEGTTLETDLFSLVYSDDWECDPEKNVQNSSGSTRAEIRLPDPESSWAKVSVSIKVSLNDPWNFSESLYLWGLDAEAAINGNNDYEVRKIGGITCWSGKVGVETKYFGYMPEENAFIVITVDDDEYWELVDPLIDSIKFNVLPAWEGDVTPWFWEGTPYSAKECSTSVGSFTVSSKQLPMDIVNPTFEIFDARIQVVGNDYYIFDNYRLRKYLREGDELKYDSEIELPFESEEIGVGADGAVYISDSGKDLTKIQNGTETAISDETDHVSLDPSCSFGISSYIGNQVSKINLADGTLTDYTLEEADSISHIMVTKNYIILSGTRNDAEKKACLIVYDHDFNERMILNKETTTTGYYGSVSAAAETENGLIVFDGNMRDVYFIDKNMSLVAVVRMSELMGVDYPWPGQAVTLEDGRVIVICTDNRADDSGDEAVVFELSGY